ncbi:hypothetical protein [Halospina sp. K52047b]|uniref:hypothetical protein n=1 Tax=Halospina sp. K52047b TaxID=2614160 RepID=UPI0017886DFC|nr:hypothetical protein [Halospina sp. K52047b]
MKIVQLTLAMVVALLAAGCSSLPWMDTPFGAPEEAWLLLARGELDEPTAEFGEVEDYWRQRLCETEQQARSRLEHRVRAELETAWAEARLAGGGNALPALTQGKREQMVSQVMAEARLLGRVRPESGRFESFHGVRLSGRLAQCLSETAGAKGCARPPVMEPVSACGDLTPAPEPLYFLEGA